MSSTEKRLVFGDREIILVGTAHISQESIEEAVSVINTEKPDWVL